MRELTNIEIVKFNENGLVPVTCVDVARMPTEGLAAVRMQAWANKQALEKTQKLELATFWSRSRGKLWTKGEESGNILILRAMYIDCDYDSIIFDVDAKGPSCHKGTETCFIEPDEDRNE